MCGGRRTDVTSCAFGYLDMGAGGSMHDLGSVYDHDEVLDDQRATKPPPPMPPAVALGIALSRETALPATTRGDVLLGRDSSTSLATPPPPMPPHVKRAFIAAGRAPLASGGLDNLMGFEQTEDALFWRSRNGSASAPIKSLPKPASVSALAAEVERLSRENTQLKTRAREMEAAASRVNHSGDSQLKALEARVRELEASVSSAAAPPPKRPAITRTAPSLLKSKASPPTGAIVVEDSYETADKTKWAFKESSYGGAYSFVSCGKKENIKGAIADGIAKLRSDPSAYVAIWYQANMVSWPVEQQRYTLLQRKGTRGFKPADSTSGAFKVVVAAYQALPPLKGLGATADRHTDTFSYEGYACAPAVCPGRGDGVGDVPGLKIIGDVDPSDIAQGGVGDCWLLSGISSLAEFDGAIARLFRKTSNLASLPADTPNSYTVTLWDLATWTEVDVTIDERLARKPDGTGLLGCEPSKDGELWGCYLEKAVAAHCGGFDKIDGGQCTHAWALLTGCKEQYTIRRSGEKFSCYGAYNPNEQRWETLANSPHDGFRGLWPMAWPAKGGGGSLDLQLTEDQLFERMCAWDDANFILGAGTKSGSDQNTTDGIHDGHAYSVLTCLNDVAGTDVDLIKMRNPHGRGEITTGEWDDDGPGWERYPQIKAELKPVAADDGIFWVSRQEFFRYFETLYLCAKDMTGFLQD